MCTVNSCDSSVLTIKCTNIFVFVNIGYKCDIILYERSTFNAISIRKLYVLNLENVQNTKEKKKNKY